MGVEVERPVIGGRKYRAGGVEQGECGIEIKPNGGQVGILADDGGKGGFKIGGSGVVKLLLSEVFVHAAVKKSGAEGAFEILHPDGGLEFSDGPVVVRSEVFGGG